MMSETYPALLKAEKHKVAGVKPYCVYLVPA